MATQTFHGSCHCKALKFEADIDLAKGTGKCNCTYCWRVRNWSARVEPAQFRWIAGEHEAGRYNFRSDDNHHLFCKTCGVRIATVGDLKEHGGPYASIMVSTLEDLPVEELLAAPVHYANGRDDDWMHTPKETRHL
jgi:hypothetical protein